MKKELVAHRDPKSPISEIFRTLRTNIQFMSSSNKLKVLQVASTLPGEGKSYVAANLAVTFAQAGKKVILIDADMRKGRQFTMFDVAPRPGLSNYLSGMDEDENGDVDISKYIKQTEVENLLLIPAGNIPPNPSELLVSPQMAGLIEDLKEVCDIVIIDGTPCALVSDSIILSRIVDTTVIVTAAKETKKDNLDRVIKNIQNVGGKIAGVVLNKVPISAKKYSEKYYYGSTNLPQPKRKTKASSNARNSEQLRRRATNSITHNMPEYKKEVEKNLNKNTNTSKNFNSNEAKTMDRPKFASDTSKVSNNYNNTSANNSGVSESKANDILGQINSYLEEQKKDLNKN